MNKTILMGRLTKDPEVKYLQDENSTAMARYTLAVERRYRKDGKAETDFISCVTFGKNAEFAENLFSNIFCKGTARRQDGQYLKIMKFASHVSAMHLAILLFHLFHSPVPSAIRLRYNRSNVPLSDEARLSKPSAQ